MRFFLSILGVVIFVVVAIVIIASQGSNKPLKKPINLNSYNNSNSALTQTTTGQLVGDGQRQAIRIVITQSERTLYLLGGYNQNVVADESFPNNSTAYGIFLAAMDVNNYTLSRKANTGSTNMFAVCPLANTYQYKFTNGSNTLSDLWSTGCNANQGTFSGDGPLIRQLFSMQIPNYSTFTNSQNTINTGSFTGEAF